MKWYNFNGKKPNKNEPILLCVKNLYTGDKTYYIKVYKDVNNNMVKFKSLYTPTYMLLSPMEFRWTYIDDCEF